MQNILIQKSKIIHANSGEFQMIFHANLYHFQKHIPNTVTTT